MLERRVSEGLASSTSYSLNWPNKWIAEGSVLLSTQGCLKSVHAGLLLVLRVLPASVPSSFVFIDTLRH